MSIATVCVNGVCTCLLPLKRNDWRPLALRHRALALVSSLLLSVKMLSLLAIAITPVQAELSTITAERVVQLTNAERLKAGRPALTVNAKLSAAAKRKGEDMLAHDYFAHISPSGVTPWFWIQQQNYSYQVAGENLAIDFVEVEDVVTAWMASPSHKDNILHEAYTETGVATVTGEFANGTSTIVVHMFGLPAEAAPAGGAKARLPVATPTPLPATAGTAQPSPTPQPDTTPPRSPRIALADDSGSAVSSRLRLKVDADSDGTVTILVNAVPLREDMSAGVVDLDVSGLADGELVAAAYAQDVSGNKSDLSNEVLVTKDSTGPTLISTSSRFVIGPQIDSPVALAAIEADEAAQIHVQQAGEETTYSTSGPIVVPVQAGEIVLAVADELGNRSNNIVIILQPQYAADSVNLAAAPQRLNRMSRWIIGTTGFLVLVLLSLAILVRISIQRPALIAHSSLVLLLAAILLFV